MEKTNISKSKLKGKTIGVVFGTFAPLHIGHQTLIHKSLMLNDGTIIVPSGYDGDRGDKIGLPLAKRFRYLREAFNDELDCLVSPLDENGIPNYPNGWTLWLDKLLGIIKNGIEGDLKDVHVTFYVSESEYKVELETRLKSKLDHFSVEFSERVYDLSATKIRENPQKYWNSINRVFRRHFTKKILVVGSASTGKSTLVKRLARTYNAPFSEEFARLYEEQANVTDEELVASDYANFILGQYNANYKEICSPSNNGLTFFDTDAIVTQVYAEMYLPADDNANLQDMFKFTIARESFDIILVIPPVTSYVDDGFRNMEWAESRQAYHDNLMQKLKDHGFEDKIVMLDAIGENDPDGFYQRYKQACVVVEQLLAQ